MKTIAENIKYPEFKETFKGHVISGHMVEIDGKYYYHSKRMVTEYSYEELPEFLLEKVNEYNEWMSAEEARVEYIKKNINAHYALVEWAKANAHYMTRSSQSESEYYFIQHTDGRTYQVRVSGHRYPTGSMTDLMLGKIDSTDTCCAKYCDMLGIQY